MAVPEGIEPSTSRLAVQSSLIESRVQLPARVHDLEALTYLPLTRSQAFGESIVTHEINYVGSALRHLAWVVLSSGCLLHYPKFRNNINIQVIG